MLKPPGPHPPAEPDRSIGDMAEQLLDDALAYGRAEVDLLKARAQEAAEPYLRIVILFALAGVFGIAALVTLFVGIAMGLARWIGPFGGAVVSTLLAAAIAGLLAWLALRDLEQAK